MHVVEWAPFKVKNGVTEAQLKEAALDIQTNFLEKQDGFVRRELLRHADGSFVDLVWWRSHESASAAIAHAGQSPACARYFEIMCLPEALDQNDHAGEGIALLTCLSEYGRKIA